MSLLDDLSDFIGSPIRSEEVTFKDKTRTFYFRELTADSAEEFFSSVDQNDPKKNKGLRNRLLSKVLCNQDGSDALTEKEAGKLPNDLANALQEKALFVNGLNKKAQDEAKNA